jgi:adenylyltransferase/sulfurtransferase
VLANTLVRAGVGLVRIVDRDFVETTNLHRQMLFDERDVAEQLPKAVAAAEKLRRINSETTVEPIVADVHPGNVETFCDGIDLIVDGTDNFQTRFLLNDVAVKRQIPWIYGGCVGAEGQTMVILPGKTPCLRCVMDDCPPPGSLPTCDTTGILAPIVNVIASLEAIEAMKILSGRLDAVSRFLTVVNLWKNRIQQLHVAELREKVDCPTCKRGEFPWLAGKAGSETAVLCGRNAVQLTPRGASVSLDTLATRLANIGQVVRNAFLLRLKVDAYELTVFADGRTIVAGTSDPSLAKTLHARYIGA